MATKTLSKSDIKKINEDTKKLYGREFLSKKDFAQITKEPIKHILVNREPFFFYHEEKLVPFLKIIYKDQFLKKVVVDMGAVKFVCNGADIMKPGITKFEETIKKEDLVVVVDEKNDKPLAIGESLVSFEEYNKQNGGKIIKNLHYVLDDKWNLK